MHHYIINSPPPPPNLCRWGIWREWGGGSCVCRMRGGMVGLLRRGVLLFVIRVLYEWSLVSSFSYLFNNSIKWMWILSEKLPRVSSVAEGAWWQVRRHWKEPFRYRWVTRKTSQVYEFTRCIDLTHSLVHIIGHEENLFSFFEQKKNMEAEKLCIFENRKRNRESIVIWRFEKIFFLSDD